MNAVTGAAVMKMCILIVYKRKERINMINEEACLMPSIKECKNFIPWFGVMFIRGQELWFGRYLPDVKEDKYTITVCDDFGKSVSGLKEEALCFFDRASRRWVMILSEHCRISWEINDTDEEIHLRMLASIAEDELKGSRGDHNDLAITNRIKNRYSTWFEERHIKNRYIIPERKGYDKIQLPIPKFVQFNDDITTVVWQDGSHTIVKRTRGDAYDEEKAVAMAVIKKMCGNNGCEMDRYFKKFFEHSADISNSKKKKGAKKK